MAESTRLRGFRDLMGSEARTMALIEDRARKVALSHGFNEIRIPLLEKRDLFERSTGETSDIVEKQIYAFPDHDEAGTLVALRPEGTPGVVRAYIDARLDRSAPEQKFFYSGPMFRRERPQRGRYRQFYQFGVEFFGRADANCDAEILMMVAELCNLLQLQTRFEINSIGDAVCRPAFRAALVEWGRAHWNELCEDCHGRIQLNPLRLLDCKIDAKLAQSAPSSVDYLCEPCSSHFESVQKWAKAGGVEFTVNPRLVRGLDYYTRTAFEVLAEGLGAQSTIVGGGRYDGLVEAMGGVSVPGIGFGVGVDRMALAIGEQPAQKLVAVISIGSATVPYANSVALQLRAANLQTEVLSPDRKLKALLGRASKIGADFAVIVGPNEAELGVVQLRNLEQSAQTAVATTAVADVINKERAR